MNTDQIEKESLKQGKRLAKFTLRLVLKLLMPFLPLIVIILLIFFMLSILIAGVYSAFPNTDEDKNKPPILAGVFEDKEKDKELQDNYYKLCDKYNVIDTWAVNEDPIGPENGSIYEASANSPFYPGGKVEHVGGLRDSNGQDKKLRLQWGQIHAATLYYTYANDLPQITKELQEETAKGLHPYFYYKKSKVITTTTDEEGNTETEITVQYLLVEAQTIQGHYQYHYQWKTHHYGKTTVTLEELRDINQILPNRWQKLEDWMKEEYNLNDNPEDLVIARTAVWESGQGFDARTEWLNWLIDNSLSGEYISQAMIPPELIPMFKEAEEKFGIPWWFLAAIAYKESSFNPQAENITTKCYGLMQVSPTNWPVYSTQLGFDPDHDKDNPRAQIFVGAYMLVELGFKNVDWKGDWKEQTLPILTFYGGFVKVPSNKPYSSTQEWCRAEYASIIWGFAEKFNLRGVVWPTPGYMTITSPFGWRIHPISKVEKFHQGIDIGAPASASVVSVSNGRVTFAGWQNPNDTKAGWGQYITVRDENHLYLYAHLSAIYVKTGDEVDIGETIGAVGSTGSSTAAHLHFEVWDLALGGSSGKPINPLLVLRN
ncbi:peptidase M23B [Desulforamulus reducens MI-1]|uniref:Peptidase M23B n=1 Tax=Desulforamulus reducens (strain ATCC BAA-1160 / DSM 100696 / MI-1) TaxID=349161 RepID=A4J318_DESRM|nr:peptidoglycan DD-metalloendopeptidase family protein [Desulforamulus reducens]ABO49471.1 peptidase M23B [Desulforamulus reducens MI-1]